MIFSGAAAVKLTPNLTGVLSGSYRWDNSAVKLGAGLETKSGSFGAEMNNYLNDLDKIIEFNFKYVCGNQKWKKNLIIDFLVVVFVVCAQSGMPSIEELTRKIDKEPTAQSFLERGLAYGVRRFV